MDRIFLTNISFDVTSEDTIREELKLPKNSKVFFIKNRSCKFPHTGKAIVETDRGTIARIFEEDIIIANRKVNSYEYKETKKNS